MDKDIKDVRKKIHDDATLRLLETLGELTLDLEINNDVTAMNFADVRIRRLEALLEEVVGDEGWISTEDEKPEGKVLIQYGEPTWGSFSQEIEIGYYDDDDDDDDEEGVWRFWLSDREVSTNGVTYWRPLPETKEVEDVDA